MEGTTAVLKDHPTLVKREDGAQAKAKPDTKELRRVLRSVKKIAGSDGTALWEPVSPGGPLRFDHYQHVLLNAFRDQLPGSIRRLQASKPIAVKTRKVVAAMLTLNRFKPDTADAA